MNEIHPTAIIGPGVELGDDNIIGPYAVLYGPARIGDRNWIGPHVVIGTPGESKGTPHPAGWLAPGPGPAIEIGSDNVIREFTVVQAAVYDVTTIGDGGFIMDRTHFSHDCRIGDGVTTAAGVLFGGHCQVGNNANIGLGAAVHQFSVIGPGAMVGMNSVVKKPIPPFSISYGVPAKVQGANRVGMSRLGIDDDSIARVHRAYLAGEVPGEVDDRLAWAFDWFADRTAEG